MQRVFLAGHRGMVGSALLRRLRADGVEVLTRERAQLDLADQGATRHYLAQTRPDAVFLAAAKVGGIHANHAFPADFLIENLQIQTNVITAAHQADVQHLLFLGSSCIYPRLAPQPMTEEALLTGPLEPTNEPYAIAKIAGIKLCEALARQYGRDYRAVMPTNLYGPGDNFHPEHAHVLPALMRRFHEAATLCHDSVTIWGTGTARREFLHVEDMATACQFVMRLHAETYASITTPDRRHLNIGTGKDISILGLARRLADVTGFAGAVETDPTRPDGAPQKLLETSRLAGLGWQPGITLDAGLRDTYTWFRQQETLRAA